MTTTKSKQAERTNADRAERAFRALLNQDYEGNVCDLLTDLRHYCDEQGLDFGAEDRTAHGHYLAELAEDHAVNR